MTSATTQPSRSTGRRRMEGHGMIVFAAVMLFIIGWFNVIFGFAAVLDSPVLPAHANYVFGTLHSWGWLTLIVGFLQVFAAAGVVAGNQLARWFGVAVLGLNAIAMMFFIPASYLWALVILAADVVALYGLCAYGSRANLQADA